jgi:hypothetical protein
MTSRRAPAEARGFKWRDALLFLPWLGLLAAGLSPAAEGWELLLPVALSGVSVGLYLVLEVLAARLRRRTGMPITSIRTRLVHRE